MSAFAVRVTSDKQTLILKGEAIPPRLGDADRTGQGLQLQRVTMLLVQGEYAAGTLTADPSSATAAPVSIAPAQPLVPYASPNRTLSSGAAQYIRTQNLSSGRTKSQLIDTYA